MALGGWKPEEDDRLRELAAKGATLMRASAALDRATGSVRKRAVSLGLTFPDVRQVRADYVASGAIERKPRIRT